MREIEVKVLNVDKQKIEEILLQLGAKQIFDGQITTHFFDYKDGSIVKAKDVLRLRKEGKKSVLTFKKMLSKQTAKVAEEYEVEISNLRKMGKILELLGLSVKVSMQKHRTSYRLNSLRFDIDKLEKEYSHVPQYLEIEAQNIKMIKKYAKLLGHSPKDCLPWSTNEVINYYSKKPN